MFPMTPTKCCFLAYLGASWATRSRSTDNLEKYSPLVGRKSPLVKMRTEGGPGAGAGVGGEENAIPTSNLLKATARDDKMRSPSSDSIKSHATGEGSVIVKTGNGILRTPIVLQKPRPWSVVGSEPKASGELVTGNGNADSTKTTPDNLEEGGCTKITNCYSRKKLSHFIR